MSNCALEDIALFWDGWVAGFCEINVNFIKNELVTVHLDNAELGNNSYLHLHPLIMLNVMRYPAYIRCSCSSCIQIYPDKYT